MLGGILRRLLRIILDVIVVLLVFTILPGIPPHVHISTFEQLQPPLPLEGPLIKNTIIDSSERILDGNIVGPESIAARGPGEIYVGLHGGKILKIWGPRFDRFKVAASIGPGCDAPWKEEVCGRPLGLRLTKDDQLLVADAYLGLFSVNLETGEKTSLFDISEEIEGFVPKIPDDLDIDNDGFIYWSDASVHEGLYKSMIEVLASPSGRLIRFDPATKTNKVLVKDLHFANGVQLTPDEDAVLVCETFKSRVHRHWIRGPRAGETEMFIERLPGSPDNIRPNGRGGYYISLITVFNESNLKTMSVLGKLPFVRKLLLRLMYVTRMLMEIIAPIDSTRTIEELAYKILHLKPIADMNIRASNQTVVVEVDADGQIIGSLQGHSGKIVSISETQRIGDHMFFGSPYNKYLGKLRIVEPVGEVDSEQLFGVEGKGVRMKEEEKEGGKEEKEGGREEKKEGGKKEKEEKKEEGKKEKEEKKEEGKKEKEEKKEGGNKDKKIEL